MKFKFISQNKIGAKRSGTPLQSNANKQRILASQITSQPAARIQLGVNFFSSAFNFQIQPFRNFS